MPSQRSGSNGPRASVPLIEGASARGLPAALVRGDHPLTPGRRAQRLLLLVNTTGYQTRAFVEAADKLGLEVIIGSDRCHVLEDPWQDGALALRFERPEESVHWILEAAHSSPIHGVVAVGDSTPPVAARAAQALGLPYHPPEAADACRDKYCSRERLRASGLKVPAFVRYPVMFNAAEVVTQGPSPVGFPCVLKPLALSASRGVIRAENPAEFLQAFERIRALLNTPEIQAMRQETSNFIQVESYIEGDEIAVEGLMDRGQLKVLAVFDKPDRLQGPFFEETIYVTPSRLKPDVQAAVIETLDRTARALALFHGPLHAELRIHAQTIWVLEVAARSIGGLCSRALRFRSPVGPGLISLEELIVRQALGEPVKGFERELPASGVMMIPIPHAGTYQNIEGVEAATSTPGVEELLITAKPGQKLVPLPEGASYLGFIFARGDLPERVEHALRCAYAKLQFVITPDLPILRTSR